MVRTPKFIETPKAKTVYSWRIDDDKLNKLNELAKLTGVNTPDLLNNIIDSYLEDKTVYNNYLESYRNYYIKLLINLAIKEYLIERNVFSNLLKDYDYNEYMRLFKTLEAKEDKGAKEVLDLIFNNYKIQRIPNNLDIFNSSDLSFNTGVIEDFKTHNGLEFYIEPDIAEYTKDFTNCLYCFYFSVLKQGVEINIISYTEAIRLLNKVNNIELIAIAESIITKLSKAKNVRSVKKIAKEWNTNNIIKLEDIEDNEANPFKIEITKDNTIIKPYDKDLDDTINDLKREVKEQTNINKVLINEIEELKKENKELNEIKTKLDTAVANAVAKTEKRIKEETQAQAKETVNNILKEYGF